MPNSLASMAPLSRPPSRDLAPSSPAQRLSRQETYQLAAQARRKSSDKTVREDLRLKLSHDHLLEILLLDIAQNERELQTSPTSIEHLTPQERMQRKQRQPEPSKPKPSSTQYDEYGFPLEDEDDEDVAGLSLMRTQSRRPVR